jgi:hypothetical protein
MAAVNDDGATSKFQMVMRVGCPSLPYNHLAKVAGWFFLCPLKVATISAWYSLMIHSLDHQPQHELDGNLTIFGLGTSNVFVGKA